MKTVFLRALEAEDKAATLLRAIREPGAVQTVKLLKSNRTIPKVIF